MSIARWVLPSFVASLVAVAAPAALAMDHNHGDHGQRDDAATEPSAHAHGHAKSSGNSQVIQLTVTKEGFEPSTVAVKAGKPVKLVVTRKVDKTCATEIVLKDFGVKKELPLDKAVTVEVTPKTPGEYRFACSMDMIAGTLKVE